MTTGTEGARVQRPARGFTTRLLHADFRQQYPNGATMVPVYQSNAFAHESGESIEGVFANRAPGFAYTRVGNPTVSTLEAAINRLEGGVATVAFASGMAALAGSLLAMVGSGDKVVTTPGLYGGTVELLQLLGGLGIRVVPAADATPVAVEAAVGDRTRAVLVETIGNPSLEVTDVAGVAEVAHAHEVPLVVDSTVTTPLMVRPLDLGADVVVHSTSKFMNGSATAIGGSVTFGGTLPHDGTRHAGLAAYERYAKLAYLVRLRREVMPSLGGCQAPQNAFYTLLGLETLGLRMERICSNALRLAEFVAERAGRWGVDVRYPGLVTHDQHDLAKRQFGGRFGAILTLRMGSKERAYALMRSLKIATIASNIGDSKTLVVHPATTTAAHLGEEAQRASGVFDDMVRVCVGIEDGQDLLDDFAQAFEGLD